MQAAEEHYMELVHTWLSAIDRARLADELISVQVVHVHALAAHMLVRGTSDNLEGLFLRAPLVNDCVPHLQPWRSSSTSAEYNGLLEAPIAVSNCHAAIVSSIL